MGIYVKGMTKPKSCDECPIHLTALPKDCNLEIGICPIVEVAEPHGRLVDIDKTMNLVASGVRLETGELSELTTIIEAEGKHEDRRSMHRP